jgi:hypothetical protein
MSNGLSDEENIAFATGYYTCVAKISILLEMYKSSQGRKYFEMMVEEAENAFTKEEWNDLKRNVYPSFRDMHG